MNMQNPFVRLPALIFALIFMALFHQSAYALCSQPPEEGSWRNADQNTNSLTRIQLRFVCQDQILNDQPFHQDRPGTSTFLANAIHQIVTGVR